MPPPRGGRCRRSNSEQSYIRPACAKRCAKSRHAIGRAGGFLFDRIKYLDDGLGHFPDETTRLAWFRFGPVGYRQCSAPAPSLPRSFYSREGTALSKLVKGFFNAMCIADVNMTIGEIRRFYAQAVNVGTSRTNKQDRAPRSDAAIDFRR